MKSVLWIFICLPFFCTAQDYAHDSPGQQAVKSAHKEEGFPPSTVFISLNGGLGLPLENYGIRNENLNPNEIQGCASTGYSVNITGGAFVAGNIAIMAKAVLDENSIDQTIFAEKNGGQVQGSFQILQYMGGIYYHVQIHPNTYLSANAMVGYIGANFPTSSETVNSTTTTITFKNTNALGYSFGLGLERMLTQTIGVNCNLSYTSTELTYPFYTITSGAITISENNPLIMEFGTMQITVGVSAHFF